MSDIGAATVLPSLPPTGAPVGGSPERKMRQACRDFESIFVYQLLQQMRATVGQAGYLHSRQEDTYNTICDQQVAASLAKGKGIGLADVLYRQLSGSQALPRPTPAAAVSAYSGAGATKPAAALRDEAEAPISKERGDPDESE